MGVELPPHPMAQKAHIFAIYDDKPISLSNIGVNQSHYPSMFYENSS